ncbi:MAG: MBOAT family O-acyltransferase [Planctomycetota bacterium]
MEKTAAAAVGGHMPFNSYTFLLFFLAVLTLHSLPLKWKTRKLNLLVASYVFYAAWNPPFVVLIWISTLVDWFAAKRMTRLESKAARRPYLILSLCCNLGLLGFFKYANFARDSLVVALGTIGIEFSPAPLDIILPVGISFYTFQTLSYTLEVYQGRARAWGSFLDFALFVTFFPQLVAGPIVRATDFLPQCIEERRATPDQLGWGLCLLTIGLFEKVVVADTLMGPIADSVFNSAGYAGFVDAWTGTLAFSAQIFFDFAGYSTCAIGVALCLGFALPDNFRWPYAAIGFSDFWRRWHISLSTWLRDYLYVPLGGNRNGPRRTHVNLMLTMLIGGLWHGASWRFVVWGGLHGLYLIAERGVTAAFHGQKWTKHWATRIALAGLTYSLVCIAWVFFRAQSFPDAFHMVSSMLTGGRTEWIAGVPRISLVAVVTVLLLAGHWSLRDSSLEERFRALSWPARSAVMASLLVAMAMAPGDNRAFIYFQF